MHDKKRNIWVENGNWLLSNMTRDMRRNTMPYEMKLFAKYFGQEADDDDLISNGPINDQYY